MITMLGRSDAVTTVVAVIANVQSTAESNRVSMTGSVSRSSMFIPICF